MISLKYFFAFGIITVCSSPALAQTSIGPSAIDAAGGSIDAGGNTYEYAIGQVVASNTFSSSSVIVTPGVLQPNAGANSIAGPSIKASELQVFPSPAEHTVFLQPAFATAGTLHWSLYSADGRLVISKAARLTGGTEKQTIDVSSFAAGQYMLQVSWMTGNVTYTSGYKIQKLR